jgi:hypothetical protein
VVSPAGARGLMQIMPAAARDHAAALGVRRQANDLNKPEVNLAFGQRHLRDAARTRPAPRACCPRSWPPTMPALLPVTRWNTEIRDQGDPLLWIESVPYWETRGYVNIVMRNYWMYERQAGGPSESRMALVQGMWPTFPGLSDRSRAHGRERSDPAWPLIRSRPFKPINIALLTVSDTRGPRTTLRATSWPSGSRPPATTSSPARIEKDDALRPRQPAQQLDRRPRRSIASSPPAAPG